MFLWNMCLLKYHVDKEFLGLCQKIHFWEILQCPNDAAFGVGILIHSFWVLRIQISWHADLNQDPLQIFLMDLCWNFQSFNLLKIKNLVNGSKVTKMFAKKIFFVKKSTKFFFKPRVSIFFAYFFFLKKT